MAHRFAYLFERFPTFTQTFCYREVREIERQGLPPALFSIRFPQDEPPQDFSEAYRKNIHYLPERDALVKTAKQLHSERKLPRAMRHLLMNWKGSQDKHRVYEAAWAGPRLRALGIRHVHVHFAGIAARTAYWLKRFYGIGYSFTGHANDIFCETNFPVSLEDLIREASVVITVSDFSEQELRRNHPVFSQKIHRVYNGVDTQLWSASSETASTEKPRIISVGRYIEKKGFADLIEAARLLHQKGRNFELEIIGGGPLESVLQKQIDDAGLQSVVTLAGPRSQTEIRRKLAQATLFALPCVRETDGGMDNLPTVIMEAMACGLPIISTPIAGVPELVLQDKTGFLVPEKNPEALADAVEKLLSDPSLCKTLGQAGRKRAEEEFAIEVTTRHLKRLLVQYGRIVPPLSAAKQDFKLYSAAILRQPWRLFW